MQIVEKKFKRAVILLLALFLAIVLLPITANAEGNTITITNDTHNVAVGNWIHPQAKADNGAAITWKSLNTSIATVSAKTGWILAKTMGTTTVIASTADGASAQFEVNVLPAEAKWSYTITTNGSTTPTDRIYPGDKVTVNIDIPESALNDLVEDLDAEAGDSGGLEVDWSGFSDYVTEIPRTGPAVDKNNYKTASVQVKETAPAGFSFKLNSMSCSQRRAALKSRNTLFTKMLPYPITFTVSEKKPVKSVTLDQKALSLSAGDTRTLNATVSPSDAYNTQVTWTSSNEGAATVDASGVVTAQAVTATDSAIITATAVADATKTASCTVVVSPQADPLKDAKDTAKAELESYTQAADYLKDDQALRSAGIKTASDAIAAATTQDGIDAALTAGKAELDKLSTKADIEKATEKTVYITITDDNQLAIGKDANKSKIARIPVTVGYFELSDYGLEAYNRYEAKSFEDGGEYINTTIVRQPTVLHAYIRFLEQYYQADGNPLKVPGTGLTPSGAATSMYMTQFFGHGADLNYYVNNVYPLMKDSWGASADYILVNDQDTIDIVLYPNSAAYRDKQFMYFDEMAGKANLDDTMAGTPISLTLKGADEGPKNTTIAKALAGETLQISDDGGANWTDVSGTTDDKGQLSITINEPGTYLISNKGNAAHTYYAKAIAKVTITENPDMTAAQAVMTKIDALPVADALQLTDEAAVTEAKAAFDALTPAQKALVDEPYQTKLNADVSKMVELKAAAELEKAKTDAKTELAGYKDQANYRVEEQKEMAEIIAAGNTAIDAAANQTDIATALQAAEKKLDALKTDAAYTAEEAKELAEAKTAAIADLTGYQNPADYREAQQAELTAAITAGTKAINAAVDKAGVTQALADAKTAIAAIKTDAQLTEDERQQAMVDAKTAIEKAEKEMTQAAVEAAQAAIDKLDAASQAEIKTEIEGLNTAVEKAKEERHQPTTVDGTTVSTGDLNLDYKLVVKKAENTDSEELAKEANTGMEVVLPLEIHVEDLKGNTISELDKSITITISADLSAYGDNPVVKIAHIKDGKVVETLTGTYNAEQKTVTFMVSSFSDFILLAQKAGNTEPVDPTPSTPGTNNGNSGSTGTTGNTAGNQSIATTAGNTKTGITGDNSAVTGTVIALILLAATGIVITISRRKRS